MDAIAATERQTDILTERQTEIQDVFLYLVFMKDVNRNIIAKKGTVPPVRLSIKF